MQAGLQPQQTGQFLGVNLRQDRVSLKDVELAKAINADLHTQLGTIILRLGRTKQNSSALSDTLIRRLARINSQRYRVAGQSVYCDTTKIIDGLLSSNLITTLTPFRPLSDTTTWAFIADDLVMKKADCTTVQGWGFGVPTTPELKIGYKSGLTGQYTLRVTGVRFAGNAVGHEGNPTDISGIINPTNQDICIGQMGHADGVGQTNGQVNGFGIYRTVTTGSSHLLVEREVWPENPTFAVTYTWEASVEPNTLEHHFTILDSTNDRYVTQDWELDTTVTTASEDTNGFRSTTRWAKDLQGVVTTQTLRWAYSTQQSDAALGDIVETDNNPPPTASWGVEFQEHLFLCRDADNPHYLWWSKRFKPESVPLTNFVEVGTPDDPIQCAIPIPGLFGVFTKKTKFRVFGNATDGFVTDEELTTRDFAQRGAISKRGTIAPLAAVGTGFGAIFVAHDGVFITNYLTSDTPLSDKIWPLFNGESVNGFDAINKDAAGTMAGETFKGRYYLAYPSGTNTQPDMIAVYSFDTQNWYFYDHPLRSLFYEEDTDVFLGGGQDGFIYILENGSSDADSDISLDVELKDFDGGNKDTLKLFQHMKIDANTLGETVTAKFYVDDTLKQTQTFSSSARTTQLFPLAEGILGYHWRIQFTYAGTKRIRIYPAAALFLPLAMA